jgi:hypothetical protein
MVWHGSEVGRRTAQESDGMRTHGTTNCQDRLLSAAGRKMHGS